jgi:hypothetical protein
VPEDNFRLIVCYCDIFPGALLDENLQALEDVASTMGDGFETIIVLMSYEKYSTLADQGLTQTRSKLLDRHFEVTSKSPFYALVEFPTTAPLPLPASPTTVPMGAMVQAWGMPAWTGAAAQGAVLAGGLMAHHLYNWAVGEAVGAGVRSVARVAGLETDNTLMSGSTPTNPTHRTPQQIATEQGKELVAALPAAYAEMYRQGEPHFKTEMRGGLMATVLKHTELIQNVIAQGTSLAVSRAINPGLADSFPWGHAIADQFEQYVIKHLAYAWTPAIGTASKGLIAMGCDFDPIDAIPTLIADVVDTVGATLSSIYRPAVFDPSEGLLSTQKRKYIRTGNEPLTQIRTADVGKFNMVLNDIGDPVGTDLGVITCSYEVELFAPEQPQSDQEYTREVLKFAEATAHFDAALSAAPAIYDIDFLAFFAIAASSKPYMLSQFKPYGVIYNRAGPLKDTLSFPKGWWKVDIRFGVYAVTGALGVYSVTGNFKQLHANGDPAQSLAVLPVNLPGTSEEWQADSVGWTMQMPNGMAEEQNNNTGELATEVIQHTLLYYSKGYEDGLQVKVYFRNVQYANTVRFTTAEFNITVSEI